MSIEKSDFYSTFMNAQYSVQDVIQPVPGAFETPHSAHQEEKNL